MTVLSNRSLLRLAPYTAHFRVIPAPVSSVVTTVTPPAVTPPNARYEIGHDSVAATKPKPKPPSAERNVERNQPNRASSAA